MPMPMLALPSELLLPPVLTYDSVLVPVWVLAVRYRDDRRPLRVVINGQTGAIAGKVPLAWWKVALALAVLAGVVAAILVLWRGAPP